MASLRKSLALVFVALFSMSLITLSFSASGQATPTWNIQTINNLCPAGSVGTIAVDSNNYPHIAYDQVSGSKDEYVMYASWNGSTWNTLKLALGSVDSLLLDHNNNPHILYQGYGYMFFADIGINLTVQTGLMYASWAGSNWTIQSVDSEGNHGSLALDSAGYPHIAYLINGTLKYANVIGSSWNIQTVNSSENSVNNLSLSLDSKNMPHILYGYDAEKPHGFNRNISETIKYAVFNGSSWNIQIVFTNLSDSFFGRMVLDSYGFPHFLYTKNDLVYASWNGSNWNMQNVSSDASDDGYLALDLHGYPHIDYMGFNTTSSTSPSLMYAMWTGTKWDIQTVGPNSHAFNDGPITIDSNYNPHITYEAISPDNGAYNACMYATANITQIQSSQIVSILLVLITILAIIVVSLLFFRKHRKTTKA